METKTHWKKTDNPNYLGSYAFEPGEEKALTISCAKEETIFNQREGKEEKKLVLHFKENEKPLILNTTNKAMIAKVTGEIYIEDWTGKGIILCVQKIKAFGELTDAVRVRPVKPFLCSDCGGIITGYGGKSHGEIREYTRKQYRRQLCAECATKAKEAAK